MHLRSITLKGFKSFPDRTRLEFGPGVSVIVGPNGSGKSNVTDAVLWAMGEQSPLAVRGQSMQDVIFGGGRGVQARSAAEEAIVTSKPRDRRLLLEEAAGLGKHRKRRRRAQLKLERTQDNLDRALDVEREARTRLRPLKRQAEAPESHARLERQADVARWALARDAACSARAAVAEVSALVAAARAAAAQT